MVRLLLLVRTPVNLPHTMLSALYKEHQVKQQNRRETQERRKKELIQSATTLTQALIESLNSGVAQAYLNQKKLDSEAKQLQINVTQFSKQTGQWIQLADTFNQALKEIGDVENWARSIELDMRTIASALEYACKE